MTRLACASLGALSLLPAPTAAQIDQGLYLSWNDHSLTSAAGATLNGSAVVAAPDPGFSLLDTPGGTALISKVELRAALALEISASGSGSFQDVLSLPPVALAPLEPIPGVVLLPFAELVLTLEGEAAPGMRASVVQDFAIPITLAMGGLQDMRLDEEPALRTRVTEPAGVGSGPLRVDARLEASLLYLIALPGAVLPGPAVGAELAFELRGDPLLDPWWELDAELDVLGGTLVGLELDLESLGALDLDVADAGGPFPLAPPPSRRWSRAFDLGQAENATAVAALGDGLALAGNLTGAGGVGWVARLDTDGTIQWEEQSSFVLGGTLRPEALGATPDGGLLMGGNTGVGAVPRVDRIDAGGASVWSRILDDLQGGILSLTSLLVRGDGGAVVCGKVQRGALGLPAVLWIAPDGALEDARELLLPGGESAAFTSVVELADGGWGLAGWVDSPAVEGLQSRCGLAVRIDAGHQALYAKALGGLGYDQLHDLAAAADGSLVLAGDLGANPHHAWTAWLDPAGALVASQHHSDAAPGAFTSLRAIEALPGGGFVLSGVRHLGAARDLWLFEIDGAGMPVWWKSVEGAHTDEPADLRVLADGIAVAGFTSTLDAAATLPSSDLWLLRSGVDGMLHFDAGLGFTATGPVPSWTHSEPALADLGASLSPFAATALDGVFLPLATAAVATLLTL